MPTVFNFFRLSLFLLSLFILNSCASQADTDTAPKPRPNILWITIEDWSPDLSCYGTKGIQTPHVDQLAAEGIRYERAFSTAPVCSPSRSAMMTGFHQNYIRANQHRTLKKRPLPYGIKPIPKLFEEAGYFTTLMSWKTDVNFLPDQRQGLFMDLKDWSGRAPGQPFFARITFQDTHRKWDRDPVRPIPTDSVELPPYYVDNDFIRRDWANGLEQMQRVDREIGALLKRLDDEGLADNTVVFFIADHGRCHIRGKQFLYDGGIRIPMIVRWPGTIQPGSVSNQLVSTLDLCATALEAAGITPPVPLHGASLLGKEVEDRKYVFAARDKMDQTHDAMRAIRSKDHKLILNLMPERPYLQFNAYKEASYPALTEMNILHLEGKLNPAQAAFFAPRKPLIELYDLRQDPFELNNVADDPDYYSTLEAMLTALEQWRKEVILDEGVATDFQAAGVFPAENPLPTVEQWVVENAEQYNFEKNGWPSWYPTRTLTEWKKAREAWQAYVYREPEDDITRPEINPYEVEAKDALKKKESIH